MAGEFGFSGFAEALASGRESRLQGRLESRRLGMEERELGLQEREFEAGLAKEFKVELNTIEENFRGSIDILAEVLRGGGSLEERPGLNTLVQSQIATVSKVDPPRGQRMANMYAALQRTPATVGREAVTEAGAAVTQARATGEALRGAGVPGATLEATAQAQGLLPAPVTPTVPTSAFTDEFGNLKAPVSNSTRQFVAQLFGGVLDPLGNFRLLNPEDAPKALEIAAAAEALLLSGQEQSVAAAVQRASRESGFFPGAPVVQPTGGEAGAPVTEVDVPIGGTAIVFEGKVHDVVQKFPNGDMLIKDREGGVPFRVRSK